MDPGVDVDRLPAGRRVLIDDAEPDPIAFRSGRVVNPQAGYGPVVETAATGTRTTTGAAVLIVIRPRRSTGSPAVVIGLFVRTGGASRSTPIPIVLARTRRAAGPVVVVVVLVLFFLIRTRRTAGAIFVLFLLIGTRRTIGAIIAVVDILVRSARTSGTVIRILLVRSSGTTGAAIVGLTLPRTFGREAEGRSSHRDFAIATPIGRVAVF